MYEIHELAAAVAEDVLHADFDYVQPESRLFRDLQALATDALCADPVRLGTLRAN